MVATDVVVVLPGIMGSTLKKNNKLVWAPSAGAALRAVLTLGESVTQLRLPSGIGDEHPNDGVEPAELLPDFHAVPGIWTPITGYDALLHRLRSIENLGTIGRVLPVAYDWRLSSRYKRRQARHHRPPRPGPMAREQPRAHPGAAGLRLPLHGWAGRPLVHRELWWRRTDQKADHPRHIVPRRSEGRRTARQRGPQGSRTAGGRPHELRPQPSLTAPAAARLRLCRRSRDAAQARRDDRARAQHSDAHRRDDVQRRPGGGRGSAPGQPDHDARDRRRPATNPHLPQGHRRRRHHAGHHRRRQRLRRRHGATDRRDRPRPTNDDQHREADRRPTRPPASQPVGTRRARSRPRRRANPPRRRRYHLGPGRGTRSDPRRRAPPGRGRRRIRPSARDPGAGRRGGRAEEDRRLSTTDNPQRPRRDLLRRTAPGAYEVRVGGVAPGSPFSPVTAPALVWPPLARR